MEAEDGSMSLVPLKEGEEIKSVTLLMVKRIVTVHLDEGKAKT